MNDDRKSPSASVGWEAQVSFGGKAVPDAAAMENSDTIGDNDSMDDDSSLLGDHFAGNQSAQPPMPGDRNSDVGSAPTISETGGGRSDDGGVPTSNIDSGRGSSH